MRPRRLARPTVLAVALVLCLGGCAQLRSPGSDAGGTAAPAPETVTVTAPPATDGTSTGTPSATTATAASVEELTTGVARVAILTCESQGSGSGFLVEDDLVITNAHVVEEAWSVSVRVAGDVRTGAVVGLDAERDLAAVRLDQPVDGHVFALRDQAASLGERVTALGYPFGQPLAVTPGAVTATDQRREVDGEDRRGLLLTDAAINPGNSGGPLVDERGELVGVVVAGQQGAAGQGYAVGHADLATAISTWTGAADALGAPACGGDEDAADRLVQVTTSSQDPEAPSLAQTFQLYAEAINDGQYDVAWQLLTPSMRDGLGSVEEWGRTLDTSYWLRLDIRDVQVVSDTADSVVVDFTTRQAAEFGPGGQTCSEWSVAYDVVLDNGFWQIDAARNLEGSPRPCPA